MAMGVIDFLRVIGNKEIAGELYRSLFSCWEITDTLIAALNTLKRHIDSILTKLDVSNPYEARVQTTHLIPLVSNNISQNATENNTLATFM
jgi:hypothetical protein